MTQTLNRDLVLFDVDEEVGNVTHALAPLVKMTLEDFERQLAAEKEAEQKKERHRDRHSHRDRDDRRRHHHHHHHQNKSHRDPEYDRDEHRSKRRRRDSDERENRKSHKHDRRYSSTADETTAEIPASPRPAPVKRDSWMEAPSAMDIDYVQRKRKQQSPPRHGSLSQDFEMKLHERELNHHLKDLQNGRILDELEGGDTEHEVTYTFGDSGSSWRMTKLKGVYRQAKDSGRKLEDVALERYGSLRAFDDAREEEIELDRRETYGKDYIGKQKPSGDLFQERKLDHGVKSSVNAKEQDDDLDDEFDTIANNIPVPAPVATTSGHDQTSINKLKAQLMKAELRKDPKASEIREKYEAALAASKTSDPTVVQISAMDNRMLSSAPRNEVKSVTNRRGRERGNVEENEEMTIEDMVAEERRTKAEAGGESKRFAERIAKDAKFTNDLEYMEENASKLASRVHKSDLNLRNVAINQYQKINSILENCPLCHHEDAPDPTPTAPVVSLATRTYLTLSTKPELAPYSTMIVPLQHHTNLLHCDDDEWEEIRNFMKSLTRFYHSRDSDVLFYENAAFPNRHPHAALVAIPLPAGALDTAPAFFKEAFLSTESEWSQHKKIIDTLSKSKAGGMGRAAFRKSLAKEMPYFHVWFELDGGLAHVVEEPDRWPKGDLFGREVVGGILGLETEVIRRQGRWSRGADRERLEQFRKRWRKFDWTRVLVEGSA